MPWYKKSRLARMLHLTQSGLDYQINKHGWQTRKNGNNAEVFYEEEDLSDDARYQKARADKMEKEARMAAKKEIAMSPEIAMQINKDWDEDFLSCFLPLKEHLVEFLKKHGGTKKEAKELETVFDDFIDEITKRRAERYANDEAEAFDADTEN